MAGKLIWFLMGVATGVAAMAYVDRCRDDEQAEDFDEIADELTKRFADLELEES